MTQQAKVLAVPEDWSTAVAIVAHPDDLEYGAASAIARWTSQGKSIHYVLATRGEAGIDSMSPDEAASVREKEQRASARQVGVKHVEFLGYKDGVIEYGLPLRCDIARAVRRIKPQVVITLNHRETWGGQSWNTPDHRALGLAVLDGARDAGNRWIFPELADEGLEPWDGVHMVLIQGSPVVTHAVDIDKYLDSGVRSLKKHEAYLSALGGGFDPEVFLRNGARNVGGLPGCKFAISFEMIRL
jgi:LmbE family N-acetylglucosaminyl deacetylase